MKKQLILSLLVVFAVSLFAPAVVNAFNNDATIEVVATDEKKADEKKADTKADTKKAGDCAAKADKACSGETKAEAKACSGEAKAACGDKKAEK